MPEQALHDDDVDLEIFGKFTGVRATRNLHTWDRSYRTKKTVARVEFGGMVA